MFATTSKPHLPNKKMDSLSPIVKSFLAGSFSGTCSTVLFQPLDLVKTRIQTIVYTPGTSIGMIQVTTNVVRNEKLAGLWKGLIPSLTRTVPGIGVYFCSLHTLRTKFGSADPHPVESIAMGVLARSMSGISMLPITVVKTRYESGRFEYSGIRNALVTIGRAEGARGLFSGLAPTLLRDAPFSGLYLMFYTQAKKYVKQSLPQFDPTAAHVHFSCGLVAGCLASMVTQPADVVKTQMQVRTQQFTRVSQVVKYIYETQGTRGFVRGVVPRTLRRTMMAAMAWTVYEQAMKSCGIK